MRLQSNLQFRKHEAEEMVLHNSATHPTTPMAGQIYYGTVNIAGPPAYNEKHLRYYDGTLWQELATRAYVDAEISGISSYDGWLINSADHATVPQVPYTVASNNKIAFIGGTDIDTSISTALGSWSTRAITINHATFGTPTATSTDSSSHISAITVSNGHVTAINTVARSVRWDSSTTVTNNIPYWNGTTGILDRTGYSVVSTITDPGGTQALATEQAIINYIKQHVHGLSGKGSVRAASTANISLASPGTAIFDGVTLSVDQRILVKNQTTASQNGIYLFKGTSTAMVRSEDANTWLELVSAYVFIEEGTTLKDTGWLCTVDQGGTEWTTPIIWEKFFHFGAATVVTHPSATGTALIQGVDSGETRLRSIKASHALLGVSLSDDPFADILLTANEANFSLNNIGGTLNANKGGTGHSVYVVGDILYANSTSTLARLAFTANGSILKLVSGVPAWSTLAASGLLTGVTHTKFNVTTTSGVAAIAPYITKTAGKFYDTDATVPSTAANILNYDGHLRVMAFNAYGAAGITGALAVTGISTLTGALSLGTVVDIGLSTPDQISLLAINHSLAAPWEVRKLTIASILEAGHGAEHYMELISGTTGTVLAEGATSHGCGNDPIVMIREKSGTNFLDVYGDIHVNASGDVTWSVDTALPADSKIIIMGSKSVRS